MTGTTLINFPKSKFLDDSTGRPSREWQQWLQNPNVVNIKIGGGGALSVDNGGTGLNTIPTLNQILIGTGTGYALGSVQSILPAFSGDASTTFGGTVITFSNVNGAPGIFGAADTVPVVTVNSKGLTTLVTTIPIAIKSSAVSGTATNDSAAAGIIGEYISSTLSAAGALTMTTGVPLNVISVLLTAGDWVVNGVCAYKPAATTNVSYFEQSINSVSATIGSLGSYTVESVAAVPIVDQVFTTPTVRISIATTTTVYLIAQAAFTVSTLAVYGFISARRER